MKKIIRLTESDLNRIVRRVIEEQGTTFELNFNANKIGGLLKSLGFVGGMENLRTLSPEVAEFFTNRKRVSDENVYSMKYNNGYMCIVVKFGDNYFVSGKFPQMKFVRRGIVFSDGITAFSFKDPRNGEYYFNGINGRDLENQLLGGIYGPSYESAKKLPELFVEKKLIKGNDLYRFPKVKDFLRTKGVTDLSNIFVSLEKETPIIVLQQIDMMNYKVIIDTYKILVDKTPQNIDASQLYKKLS